MAEVSTALAVDALTEAAGAGEHGRRSGVVAGEITTLAERSRQAASAIRSTLSELGGASATALTAMRRARGSSRAGWIEDLGDAVHASRHHLDGSAGAGSSLSQSIGDQLITTSRIAAATRQIDLAMGESAGEISSPVPARVQQRHLLGHIHHDLSPCHRSIPALPGGSAGSVCPARSSGATTPAPALRHARWGESSP